MILIHAFSPTGERRVVTLDGVGHVEARDYCAKLVKGGCYRAAIFDRLSTRYTFDTDDAWYTPVAA